MFVEYLNIFKYIFLCLGVVLLLFAISFFFVYHKPDFEKLSSYECGFNPFGDARNKFEIRFYLVAILFIIFDLEVTFLFPFVVAISNISLFGIFTMIFFIFILAVGFIYE